MILAYLPVSDKLKCQLIAPRFYNEHVPLVIEPIPLIALQLNAMLARTPDQNVSNVVIERWKALGKLTV